MLRYHKQFGFPKDAEYQLEKFTDTLNRKPFDFGPHFKERMRQRVNLKKLQLFMKDLKLSHKDIFEYYAWESGEIEKCCYKMSFDDRHNIVLVVAYNKFLVTVYVNPKNMFHKPNPLLYS